MTGSAAPQKRLWILCVVLISTVRGESRCPKGGRIHLASLRCYWLSDETSSWFDAQDSCRHTWGGDLASAESKELQNFIYHSFPRETTVWVWMRRLAGEEDDLFGEPPSPVRWDTDSTSRGLCPQKALGTPGRWRRAKCAGRCRFICETQVTESLPSVDIYLTGLLLLTGVNSERRIRPLPSAPDTGQHTVEMLLFPGLWFSHAGQLTSVELVVQPTSVSSLARIQILRPYCSPSRYLVPPGCSSLLNPFSCCAATPLCNTKGGCSVGQYWCHLVEACMPTSSPCSPYSTAAGSRGFALPPRYPALPPFYHLVADLPLKINPSAELKTLSVLQPEEAILVYPDDIVAVQHTLDSGKFLHCLNSELSLNSPWRQSYLSLRGAEWGGWWEGGLTSLPQDTKWVDGVVCDLRILYEDALHSATEHETVFHYTHKETVTVPDIGTLTADPLLRSKFRLDVIHPLPDEKNHIHVQVNVPTLIVVKSIFGEKARSSWSAPILKTGVPFYASCPEEVVYSAPGCKKQPQDDWFSSVTLVLPSPGVQTLSISMMDADSFQSVNVQVYGYEAVTGLRVEPQECRRILINTSQLFKAKVESGSSVKFTWVVDNLEKFGYEGESYSVMFKQPAEYKLQVTASNPVSSQRQQILLTADEMTPLAQPEFLFVREVVAVDATLLYTVRVKVDISLSVTFKWDFGDGRNVIHMQSAPCQSTEGLVERGEKQIYIDDSVNHTYSTPEDYTLHVQVSTGYDITDATMEISVSPQLIHILILPSTLTLLVKETLHLEAFINPSGLAVVYTWNFGDDSKVIQGIHHKVSHSYRSAGVYNITVCASNNITSPIASLLMVVMEKISGLTVTYSGQSEVGSPTDFRAEVATGNSLIWEYDFGDGCLQENFTEGSVSHIYTLPGNFRVGVTVSNSVSRVHQSITVEVYNLTLSGVLPTECVMTGKHQKFTALANGNISTLTFHWLFGDDSPLMVMTGQSTATHTFLSPGVFPLNLTVFSLFTFVSLSKSICVESPITKVLVQSSREVAAVEEEVCVRVFVFPEQNTGYQFCWFSSPSGLSESTESSEKCFVFINEGVEKVSVVASNKVSNQTAKVNITVQKPVRKLSVAHESQSDSLIVNKSLSFWVASCAGSNVSVLWDFGDGSPVEQKQNVTHVFTSNGKYTVTATAFNAVSHDSAILTLNVLLPVSDLRLYTSQPSSVVGEETLITSISSATDISNYHWIVDGITATRQGTYLFRYTFPKPGVYQVKAIAQNLVSKKEATILIEVLERIAGPQIECRSLINKKYIPTLEEMLFIASVTKGSNVTYHWLVTQSGRGQQIRGDGELFYLMVETSGRISVQLTASSILGVASNSVSLVAVEHVTGACVATHSNTVALGKPVNISVHVLTGSDLHYLWYVNADVSPLRTHVPFFLYTFTNLGLNLLKVSVQNALSQSNDTKQFLVQEEVLEVDFQIDGKKHPFSVNASVSLSFYGSVHRGNDLHWDWEVKSAKETIFTSTYPTFVFRFSHADIYEVYLNVSNDVSWKIISHNVTVQEAVEGLLLNIGKASFCTNEQIEFIPTISNGSNVRFGITFQKNDWIHSQDISEGQLTRLSLPAGKYLVTLKATNQVSSAEISSNILVTESIQGLQIVNCCYTAFEVLKGIYFKANVQSGLPVNYTWIFQLERSRSTWLIGQEVNFSPQESGLWSVCLRASNGVCSQTINETVTIEWPVQEVNLVRHSERIFVGHGVRVSATVKEGSNVRYSWDFGDFTEILVTDQNEVSHTYHFTGQYRITLKVFNNVSHVSTQLHMEVEELQCSIPQASLVQSQSSTILRSRQNFFEASVYIKCSAYRTNYLWEIFRDSCFNSGNKVNLRNQKDAASPLLLLPKSALDIGHYCLVFIVSFQGTPLFVQKKTNITVVHSPLVAFIKGGSHRLWSGTRDLFLDGSESHDPDMEPGEDDALQYHWAFVIKNSTESPLLKQLMGSFSRRITVPSSHLQPGAVYVFTLTVHKTGRRPASANQTVTVTAAPVLHVTVKCVSCSVISSDHRTSGSIPVVLAGQCEQCDGQARYSWKAEDQSGQSLDLSDQTTSTGRLSHHLAVRSGVLQPGWSYSFVLNVSQPGSGQWGSSSLRIQAKNPPRHGQCDISPESDIHLLETEVTYNCSGWQDESGTSQLIYTLQVAPCQPVSTECPVLTLYRGTRSTFSSLVPAGSPGQPKNMSLITVTLVVEDHLGAKAIALNRTLTIENPSNGKVASQWLRNKSQTELWALIQHRNPQEIIPYSIALTSMLRQMEFRGTAEELADSRELWENVTQVLVSLPVSSLQDVDQLSSVLAQSTAVPRQLLCWSCQERILEVVRKIIHVMKEQMSPADLPAASTGESILRVLGGTLAAVSELVHAAGSDSAYTRTLQEASAITVSALGYAAALMRTLMYSRVQGQAPLSLSTNYIKTVAFLGDPSDLLCTPGSNGSNRHQTTPSESSLADKSQSAQPCQFLIPNSLSAHLKNQNSEVVQVLLSMDGPQEANSFLASSSPRISTAVVAMELTTPQGQPIPIQNLDVEQAIRVTLPNKYPLQSDGGGNGGVNEAENGTCLTVTLPREGQLNFKVKALDGLVENAGLYISFNFSLPPGATPVRLGRVKAVVVSVPGSNASQESLMREWALTLSAASSRSSSEETIFLSPLSNGTHKPFFVNLSSSLIDGGPVRVSVCAFSSLCQYFSVAEMRWSSAGLRPLEGSTLQAAQCLSQHLTMFGASLFVHPGAVIMLPPSGGPVKNIVAGIVCAVLVLLHLLVGLIAHKLDHMDSLRLSQVPLCGRPGLYFYRVLVKTGWRPGAGTTAHVGISLYGVNKSGSRHLQRDGAFQRGSLDQFHIETDGNLGEIWKIRIWHDNTGLDPSWYVQHVAVWDPQTDHMFFFLLEDWLSVDNQRNSTVEREVLATCPEDLTQFRRVLASQLIFGMTERHLWLSLWERPAHSCFTRGQRVTCSALLLHLYLTLGALWYGAVSTEGLSGPVSAHLLVNWETVAVGMAIAILVFPLQCFLCFLFRKAQSQVTVDVSVPPSPVCHYVEMDYHLSRSESSGPSSLSASDSSGLVRESPSSLLESKALDSSILDFWAASGLVPQRDGAHQEEAASSQPSRDSLHGVPASSCSIRTTSAPELCEAPHARGSSRQLRRKKALMQLHLASPASSVCPTALLNEDISSFHSSAQPGLTVLHMNPNSEQIPNPNMATLLTLSEEDLLMSIAAEKDTTDANKSNSDSGRGSPRTSSSFSAKQSSSWSSWSEEQSEPKLLSGAEVSQADLSSYGEGLCKCPSVLSVDSVASTFLPGSSHDSGCSSSTTRLGVARGEPSGALRPWVLYVIYPLVAVLLGACLAVVGLYGSVFSKTVVLMWLVSALSAFFTSFMLLEPLKVCVQALICTVLLRPVDPEVEEVLAQETTVVPTFGEHGGKVRPPCGYGLLQAQEEARKVRALRSLMRTCVGQLLFLLLVLMVNYQDRVEQRQGRLLHASVRQRLRTAQLGSPNLTSLRNWSDAEHWINHTLVPHLHQNPSLHLVGLPRLQFMCSSAAPTIGLLGNASETTQQILADMNMAGKSKRQFKRLSIDFTHYHRESGLFVCVSIKLELTQSPGTTSFLSIHPLVVPLSFSGLDLHVALTVILLISALLITAGELWSMVTERAQPVRQCRHWFQLLLAFLALATAVLQLFFLSVASSCLSKLRSNSEDYVDFHAAALLAESSSQCAAVLLSLLVLKLLGTLKLVRKWVMIGRVLQRAWRELWAVAILVLLLLLLRFHLGNVLFSHSVEGFLTVPHSRMALRKLCGVHPVLGPLYGLLLMGGGVWLWARLCGAILIRAYREEKADSFHPTIEPQDYEMVEFFIKRLKLWMGITKPRQFRHRVKFEGMDVPPSRSSQESSFSVPSSTFSLSHSPSSSSLLASSHPLSSTLSVSSEDLSVSRPRFEVQPYLDSLEPIVSTLLARFDRVNQVTEDLYNLEVQLEEAQARRKKRQTGNKDKEERVFGELGKPKKLNEEGVKGEVRHRKVGILHPRPRVSLPPFLPCSSSIPQSSVASVGISPRMRSAYSESEPVPFQLRPSRRKTSSDVPTPGICGSYTGSTGFGRFPRRRAWHSGSSHSADASQRAFQPSGTPPCRNGGGILEVTNARPRSEEGVRGFIRGGVPVKRKAWISEGLETEED
ncbi:polycystin-1 [Cololabis saira]|uniref:polycystin-1 n=1 Tax=Cololabis saira TaxID=129043 RepID=UPI002AD1F25D|nr:polycystin-1 [Cololabis saira]